MANTVNDIEPNVRIYKSNLHNMGRFHDESLFQSRLGPNTVLASLQFKSGLPNKSLA